MGLEVLFGAAYVLAAAVSLWSLGRLNGFLAATRSIADRGSLARFKDLARQQMYLALAIIVLMGLGIIAGIIIISRYGLRGLAVVIVANFVVLGLGLYHKKVEGKVRALPAGSEALAEEYRRVSETWVKKALPDF